MLGDVRERLDEHVDTFAGLEGSEREDVAAPGEPRDPRWRRGRGNRRPGGAMGHRDHPIGVETQPRPDFASDRLRWGVDERALAHCSRDQLGIDERRAITPVRMVHDGEVMDRHDARALTQRRQREVGRVDDVDVGEHAIDRRPSPPCPRRPERTSRQTSVVHTELGGHGRSEPVAASPRHTPARDVDAGLEKRVREVPDELSDARPRAHQGQDVEAHAQHGRSLPRRLWADRVTPRPVASWP